MLTWPLSEHIWLLAFLWNWWEKKGVYESFRAGWQKRIPKSLDSFWIFLEQWLGSGSNFEHNHLWWSTSVCHYVRRETWLEYFSSGSTELTKTWLLSQKTSICIHTIAAQRHMCACHCFPCLGPSQHSVNDLAWGSHYFSTSAHKAVHSDCNLAVRNNIFTMPASSGKIAF